MLLANSRRSFATGWPSNFPYCSNSPSSACLHRISCLRDLGACQPEEGYKETGCRCTILRQTDLQEWRDVVCHTALGREFRGWVRDADNAIIALWQQVRAVTLHLTFGTATRADQNRMCFIVVMHCSMSTCSALAQHLYHSAPLMSAVVWCVAQFVFGTQIIVESGPPVPTQHKVSALYVFSFPGKVVK